MSYKNDHMLVIANKYGKASGDAKAMVFETYDRLRDITLSGPSISGNVGYGALGQVLVNFSRLLGPTHLMPILGSSAINIPGTSYHSPISGGNSILPGAQSSFGFNQLPKYPGFPSGGAAPIGSLFGVGLSGLSSILGMGSSSVPLANTFSIGGMPTGGAASVAANVPGGNTYVPAAGALTGISAASGGYTDITMPLAGTIAGIGGLVSHLAPYFGPSGLVAALAGNLASGYAGAAVSSYNYIAQRIITNADSILTMKIKNLETTVKQLDTQGDIVRKMLKGSLEGDKKAVGDI